MPKSILSLGHVKFVDDAIYKHTHIHTQKVYIQRHTIEKVRRSSSQKGINELHVYIDEAEVEVIQAALNAESVPTDCGVRQMCYVKCERRRFGKMRSFTMRLSYVDTIGADPTRGHFPGKDLAIGCMG